MVYKKKSTDLMKLQRDVQITSDFKILSDLIQHIDSFKRLRNHIKMCLLKRCFILKLMSRYFQNVQLYVRCITNITTKTTSPSTSH